MGKFENTIYVESIGAGKKTGVTKSFTSRPLAERYAQTQIKMGKGVSLAKGNAMPFLSRNMKVTALAKNDKYGFTKNVGKFTVKPMKTQTKKVMTAPKKTVKKTTTKSALGKTFGQLFRFK